MKLLSLGMAGIVLMSGSVPASASVYRLKISGIVQLVEGDANGSAISAGDAISAAFEFDDAAATGPTILELGGGTYSIYGVVLKAITLSVGAYSASYAEHPGTLTYMDDSFGSDGIVLSLDGLPGGPFNSTFANIQFQARGPSSRINGSGLTNGLPYESFDTSFFGAFGNDVTNERVFGSLNVSNGSAAPEPMTWAMLVGGFGAIGGIMRVSGRPNKHRLNLQPGSSARAE